MKFKFKLFNFFTKRLQLKIAVGTTVIVFMVVGSSTYFTIHAIQNQMLNIIKQKLYETDEKISKSFTITDANIHDKNIKQLFTLIKMYPHHGVQISLFDADGKLVVANDSNIYKKIPLAETKTDTSVTIFKYIANGAEYLVANRRIPNKPTCYNCHGKKNPVLGAVQVSVSLSQFNEKIRLISDMLMGNGLLSFIVMTIALGLMIRQLVSKSLTKLSEKMRQVEDGNLNVNLSCTRDDEIGVLCRSFVTMVDRLHSSRLQIEETYQQELQHADRLATLGELAAGLAHEIRNPLAGISGAIHVLAEEMDEHDPNSRIMNEMQNEISRLNNTLSRFLAYSRPAEPEFSEVDLYQVIENSLSLCKRSSQFTGIELVKNFNPVLKKIYIDPILIQQAFINIILNAVQALNHKGKLTISVNTVHNPQNDRESVKIEFIDNGPGISKHILDNIFQPFFSSRSQGTGLGLAIVKHIVNQHNGTIFVKNNKEGGARFTIILPTKQNDRRI